METWLRKGMGVKQYKLNIGAPYSVMLRLILVLNSYRKNQTLEIQGKLFYPEANVLFLLKKAQLFNFSPELE